MAGPEGFEPSTVRSPPALEVVKSFTRPEILEPSDALPD